MNKKHSIKQKKRTMKKTNKNKSKGRKQLTYQRKTTQKGCGRKTNFLIKWCCGRWSI